MCSCDAFANGLKSAINVISISISPYSYMYAWMVENWEKKGHSCRPIDWLQVHDCEELECCRLEIIIVLGQSISSITVCHSPCVWCKIPFRLPDICLPRISTEKTTDFNQPLSEQSKEWQMGSNASGNCERGSRRIDLKCIRFPGLFLDAILCLLRQTTSFNSQDMLIFAGCQDIAVEPNLVRVSWIWRWASALLSYFPRYDLWCVPDNCVAAVGPEKGLRKGCSVII